MYCHTRNTIKIFWRCGHKVKWKSQTLFLSDLILLRFRLLVEMICLQPKHITNSTHPYYSSCRKFCVLFGMHFWYPHKMFVFMHRHSSWKQKTKWLKYRLHILICFWINLFLEENWSIYAVCTNSPPYVGFTSA